MKRFLPTLLTATCAAAMATLSWTATAAESSDVISNGEQEYAEGCPEIFHHTMKQLHSSKMLNLCEVTHGQPVLLVNTASHCGFTDQFGDLEKLHKEYEEKGLIVLGVSSDSFNQEADDEAEAADVCFKNFGVTFTMLSTVPVRGDDAHPLFQEVARQDQFPRWNFYKFLINREGQVVASNSSFGMPDKDLIDELLAE
ncbi:MAG: glutathione peroxidase [Thalassolituus sp.]